MKKYIVAGLLVWLPLAVTIWVLAWVLGVLDGVFQALLSLVAAVLPASAAALIESISQIPGLGVIVLVVLMLLTGMFVANFVGQWWIRMWDRIFQNIPIVKSIYSSVKQVSDTLFSSSGQAFREAVLVQYPRDGLWTIAFVTGKPGGEVGEALQGDYVSLYVPTTPNPTSGFFLMAARTDIRPLAMSVDEALKYIISMGVVGPENGAPGEPEPAPH
ncbi:DUF502 domain-containing protein [Sphaerotilus mobilis]|uniref:Putative membrane protein n=1 Tax=Sphaerotilus mobilis TaxID=47994 RepID=A0A4Q7LK93_9BURK|nr:DUF502 domain-containing protein [Sphaerotilus mobilis]RZS54834.1 putative membrane protein [Sphaerotilus mobilis]